MLWEGCNGPRSNKSRSYHEIVFLGDVPEGSFGPLEGFFGRKSVPRKSSEVRLGAEWAEYLSGWSGSAVVSQKVIYHGHITWGRPQKHDLGLIWAPGAFQRPLEAKPDRQE